MEVTAGWEGGFAGQHAERTIDTTVGRRIEQLVADSRFFELPEFLGGQIVSDGYTWRITLVDGDRSHSVWWGMDATVPAPVDELWDLVGPPPPGAEPPGVNVPGETGDVQPATNS